MDTTPRYHLIDAIRGLTIISMVLYHSCYDYFIIFNNDYSFIRNSGCYYWQQSICITFNLISGFVWFFGRKHALKNGLIINLFGLIITIISVIFIPSEAIYFGVLTFLGSAMIIMLPVNALIQKLCPDGISKSQALIGVIINIALFAIFRHLPNGYCGTFRTRFFDFPSIMYKSKLLIPFGFPTDSFVSSDYFPLLPWLFMYLTGYFLAKLLPQNQKLANICTIKIPFLSYIGKKSLLIYLLHQPLCFGITWLLSVIL